MRVFIGDPDEHGPNHRVAETLDMLHVQMQNALRELSIPMQDAYKLQRAQRVMTGWCIRVAALRELHADATGVAVDYEDPDVEDQEEEGGYD